MFVCTVLNAETDKYCYARARILDLVENEIVKLPVDNAGNPDWQFMEDYIKSLPFSAKL